MTTCGAERVSRDWVARGVWAWARGMLDTVECTVELEAQLGCNR